MISAKRKEKNKRIKEKEKEKKVIRKSTSYL